VDDSQECGIENPFTIQPSPEQLALKEQQASALAPKSGQSKILKKARQKMLEEAKRKDSDQPAVPRVKALAQAALKQEPGDKLPEPVPPSAPQPLATQRLTTSRPAAAETPAVERTPASIAQAADAGVTVVTSSPPEWGMVHGPPTSMLHQISRDYEQEFPEVLIGPRTIRRRSHNMDNVDLENEEMDSEEEWEQLIEATDPSALQLSTPLTLLRDQAFHQRVRARLGDSSTQVLEGMLEGASRLRPALRVIGNLLATRCDWDLLHTCCRGLGRPSSCCTSSGRCCTTRQSS
uniref:serine/threonine-protein kinase 36-like n=1 Tax=Pristiophorus japonicus TaxID=55135 RepID=UPI00398E45C1